MGKVSILKALSKLTSSEISENQLDEFYRQTTEENNDRGAAILLAAHLEDTLELALERRLGILAKNRESIFDYPGPLSTFAAKILMACAIGLIGRETETAFGLIRPIRNAFAHAKSPISFETPEVRAACESIPWPLVIPPVATGPDSDKGASMTPKMRFKEICERLSHNLLIVTGVYGGTFKSDPLHASVAIQPTPQSLP